RAAGACEFVVVVEPVDRDGVAARAQTPESEAAAGQRSLGSSGLLRIRAGDPGGEQDEIQEVASSDWTLLNPLVIHRGGERSLGRRDGRRLRGDGHLLLEGGRNQPDVQGDSLADGELNSSVTIGRNAR